MYKLTESFPYLLNRVGVRMGELFARRIASYDVTVPAYRVMAALREKPDQRLNDLADMTTIEISTLSRLVGSMEKRALVSRVRLLNNARTVAITLTAAGTLLIDELMPIAKHFEDVTIAGMPDAKLNLVRETLLEVFERLDALEQETAPTD
ncbi:MAG: MarR family winged helix-turn-helix transcriptional regulator [Pseudomonadota bacterium]